MSKSGFRSKSATEKLAIIHERDRGICQLCFKSALIEESNLDHIIAHHRLRYLVGFNRGRSWNLQLAHIRCNKSRGGLTIEEFDARNAGLWAIFPEKGFLNLETM